jgi:hypothetical protein
MAYTFNGSTQYLRASYSTNDLVSAWPMTMFVRAKSTNLTARQVAATYLYSNSPYNGIQLYFAGDVAGDPLSFWRFGSGLTNSVLGYSSGVWNNWAGRSYSNTVVDVDVENTVTTGPTTSVAWQNASAIMIGARLTPGISLQLTGSVANVAMWNVALDDAEVASLVAGFSPRRVRPQSLVFYAPLVRELVVPKSLVAPISSLAATASPTVSDHPRSYGF